jgi:hypothetical protein
MSIINITIVATDIVLPIAIGIGGMRRAQWIEDKTAELLPTSYFHTVFTVPHELNSVTMGNRKVMYDLLFEASSYTLLTLAKDNKWLGATPGIIGILHTSLSRKQSDSACPESKVIREGQDLSFHLVNTERAAVYF